MRVLITNDDGIHAPGLKVLERIAGQVASEVWVVAPETEQSGASHSLTLADPLRLREIEDRRFAVKGTPTDCVLMAVKKVMPEKPDLILSGVNRGQNIAEDVTYSGTIAAAMEGTAIGIPSIALSQTYGFDGTPHVRWETAEHHAPDVLRRLAATDWGEGVLINVNFPDVDPGDVVGVAVTDQGKRDQSLLVIDEREDARHQRYYWLGFERRRSNPADGTDLRAIYDGQISVTPLHMNLTHHATKESLRNVLADGHNEMT